MPRFLPMLFVVVCLVGACAQPLHYTMMAPQISAENRFIGPEVEISFRFAGDRMGILVVNTSEGDISVDWSNCSFVTAEGHAVRLVPVGEPPLEMLPPGARFAAVLTLDRWHKAGEAGPIWRRRETMGKRLIYTPQLTPGVPASVKIHLAFVFWELDEMGIAMRRDENFAFEFAVQDPKEMAKLAKEARR